MAQDERVVVLEHRPGKLNPFQVAGCPTTIRTTQRAMIAQKSSMSRRRRASAAEMLTRCGIHIWNQGGDIAVSK